MSDITNLPLPRDPAAEEREAIAALERLGANVTERIQWIPVTRALPDDEATVLVYAPQEDEPVTLGYLDGGYWRAVDVSGDEPCLYRSTVTHWATLPKGPQ